MKAPTNANVTGSNKRRSQRVIISMPVTISGKKADGAEFQEDTTTLVINAHGALVSLAAKVKEMQSLNIRTRGALEIQECRVVYIGHTDAGKTQIAIEFLQPAPLFWHISFPPEDWSASVLDTKGTPVS